MRKKILCRIFTNTCDVEKFSVIFFFFFAPDVKLEIYYSIFHFTLMYIYKFFFFAYVLLQTTQPSLPAYDECSVKVSRGHHMQRDSFMHAVKI